MSNITLRDVAHVLAYSPAHLTHTFRQQTGTPITAWIIERRIRAAAQMLLDGNASVATVCETVGFNDVCYFTRQFVRLIGTTPRRYRRRVGSGEAKTMDAGQARSSAQRTPE